MVYKTIIGLEIHVELLTKTKMFCNCTNEFGGEANTHCCPICLGLPGALPKLNSKALEYAIKTGLAFDCNIANKIKMDRKHYFYSDLVKGFQISQDDNPICQEGHIDIEIGDKVKEIGLIRIHIEEDTGKSIHTETMDTLLDYNRAGVPLIEIVSKPDINSSEEAKLFLDKLVDTLKYLQVSDCKMEEGSLRCDINVNVVNTKTGARSNIAEIKNLNSFRGIVRAIEFEEKRHIGLLEQGLNTEIDTRRWDEVSGETISMRSKGEESDYRFIPEGDISYIYIEKDLIEDIRKKMPELPDEKKKRFIKEYDLPQYDAGVLTQSRDLALFFEEVYEYVKDSKIVSNWIMGDVLRRLNEEEMEIKDLKFNSNQLGELILLVKDNKINNNTGKKVLKEMFETGKKPGDIVEEKGLIQISDTSQLEEIIEEVLSKNEQSIIDFNQGKDRALGFLVGQVMKLTRGKANPQMVNQLLVEKIKRK